jgi:DNA adenine methylase
VRYLGGKTRIAKQLAAEIDKVRRPGQLVWDAFCGGLSMTRALAVNGPVYSTDACAPLINLYRAVQTGWDPPTEVDEATYRAAKLLPDTDPMKAFCGFGCSFSGKWFAGYAKRSSGTKTGGPYNPVKASRNAIVKDCVGLSLDIVDFTAVKPHSTDAVLYLDPPYIGTAEYVGCAPFNHVIFYDRVREWSAHCHVFVSEYQMPFGHVVFEVEKAKSVAGGNGGGRVGVERLYFIERGSL